MDLGLKVKVIWKDNHIIEVRLVAWNGHFGGEADIYLSYGVLREMADAIEGFPAKREDDRIFVLGELNPDGCGGASIRLHTKDQAGHLSVTVVVITGTRNGTNQSVMLNSGLEAAAIDDFVLALRAMEDEEGSSAVCRFSL